MRHLLDKTEELMKVGDLRSMQESKYESLGGNTNLIKPHKEFNESESYRPFTPQNCDVTKLFLE